MFLDRNFLHDAGMPAIREHLSQKLAYLCLHGFWPKMEVLGQNRRMGGAILTPNKLFLLLEIVTSVPLWRKSIKKLNLSHAICYSYWADC